MDTRTEAEAQAWDGETISAEPPYGAAIVVFRREHGETRFLVLHRADQGPEFAGDWAWGPPSGGREPGEPIDQCATRELLEETSLGLHPQRTAAGSPDWFVYLAEAPRDAVVALSSEHDHFAWLSLDEAATRILPDVVRQGFVEAARTIN